MQRFSNKTVLVTGAGSGIGAATAARFAGEGANVVLAGRRKDALESVAKPFDAARTLVHTADVSDPKSVEALVAATVARFGGLDVLVNNAGVAKSESFLHGDIENWHTTMSINVDGVVYCSRSALPHLLESRGNIVNVSSVSGLGGDWGLSFYNASKGAVTNLTRSLALEFGRKGIRVNAVNPSLTSSEMTTAIEANEALMAKFADRIPIGRIARADEVAAVIAFLASDDASFVNGVNLPVDGGVTASNGQPRFGRM
jgi:meso-butanediol dehydrogenase/(S,S)-butanediol dehydrogenase/diacetyl reductase